MNNKLTIAVIGCGSIANGQHLPRLSANPKVRLKYVCDIIESKADKAKIDYNAEQAIYDYNIALNDPEVEAVYVLTQNYGHYTITMDALKANKHVFCEKPITVNYKLSKEMYDMATKMNKVLDIGVVNRYHKSVCVIKDLLESGKLGNLYHIYCSFRQQRCIPGLGGPFTTKSMSGGGVLIDWGVHFLDLILYITSQKVKSVSAKGYNALGKDIKNYVYKNMWAHSPDVNGTCDVEDFISGFVRLDNSTISFNGAWAQNIGDHEMYVDFLGDKAGIRWYYRKNFIMYSTEGDMLTKIEPDFNIPDSFTDEDIAFVDGVLENKTNRNNIKYVLETAKLLDMIYESSEKEIEIKA